MGDVENRLSVIESIVCPDILNSYGEWERTDKIEFLEREIRKLWEEFRKLSGDKKVAASSPSIPSIPAGWLTMYEFSDTYLFISSNHLSTIIRENNSFFKDHHKWIDGRIYIDPCRVMEFVLYHEKCGPKIKSMFKKILNVLPTLQELQKKITSKKGTICL